MDAELARSVVDDAFEGLGTPECLYEPPGGGSPVGGLVLILHRSSAGQARGGVKFSGRGGMSFESDVRSAAVVYLTSALTPAKGGVFTINGQRWRAGEEPLEDDGHGYSGRIAVVRA